MDELFAQSPEYRALEIEIIDEIEHPEISDNYDYELVPAFYIDEKLVHSGIASPKIIRGVFDAALKDS